MARPESLTMEKIEHNQEDRFHRFALPISEQEKAEDVFEKYGWLDPLGNLQYELKTQWEIRAGEITEPLPQLTVRRKRDQTRICRITLEPTQYRLLQSVLSHGGIVWDWEVEAAGFTRGLARTHGRLLEQTRKATGIDDLTIVSRYLSYYKQNGVEATVLPHQTSEGNTIDLREDVNVRIRTAVQKHRLQHEALKTYRVERHQGYLQFDYPDTDTPPSIRILFLNPDDTLPAEDISFKSIDLIEETLLEKIAGVRRHWAIIERADASTKSSFLTENELLFLQQLFDGTPYWKGKNTLFDPENTERTIRDLREKFWPELIVSNALHPILFTSYTLGQSTVDADKYFRDDALRRWQTDKNTQFVSRERTIGLLPEEHSLNNVPFLVWENNKNEWSAYPVYTRTFRSLLTTLIRGGGTAAKDGLLDGAQLADSSFQSTLRRMNIFLREAGTAIRFELQGENVVCVDMLADMFNPTSHDSEDDEDYDREAFPVTYNGYIGRCLVRTPLNEETAEYAGDTPPSLVLELSTHGETATDHLKTSLTYPQVAILIHLLRNDDHTVNEKSLVSAYSDKPITKKLFHIINELNIKFRGLSRGKLPDLIVRDELFTDDETVTYTLNPNVLRNRKSNEQTIYLPTRKENEPASLRQ